MTTTATINPAILDVDAMIQKIDDKNTIETLFGNVFSADYDLTLQSSSVEEYKEFFSQMYAMSAIERKIKFVNEEDMIFKVEKIEKYGDEEFLAKTFYRLRKFGQNYMFDEFSVSSCIHAGGFVPVQIVKIDNEFNVKFLKNVFGEGKRVTKSEEGRNFIKSSDSRWDIWTDM